MTWKERLLIVSIIYGLLIVILLHFLPPLDSLFGIKEERHAPAIHSHILTKNWMLRRCHNLTQPLVKRLQTAEIDNWFYFLSAYYDKRKDSAHYIRVLAIVRIDASHRKVDINLHCHVPIAPHKYFTSPVLVYEMNENHGMAFRVFILSCPLPPHLQHATNICMVRLTNGPDAEINRENTKTRVESVDLALYTVPQHPVQYNFTVCIPPMHHFVETDKLINFIELTRLLGAEHFVLYKMPQLANNKLTQVLNYYQKLGVVTLFDWQVLRSDMKDRIWYFGQVLAIHHCLYHTMGKTKYTVFQDLDELIIPQKHSNWRELMTAVDDGTKSGFRFFSKFFQPQNNFFEATVRSKDYNQVRTKCIVKPQLIFEMGIHHVSKQNVESMPPITIHPDKALVYHYRPCDNFYTGKLRLCKDTEEDNRLLAWKKDFHKRKTEAKLGMGL